MARKAGRPEDVGEHVVLGVEINARSRRIEITTMQRGSGRHVRYGSLNLAPPELRGQALGLIREAILEAGYSSLAELEEALTSELVLPEDES